MWLESIFVRVNSEMSSGINNNRINIYCNQLDALIGQTKLTTWEKKFRTTKAVRNTNVTKIILKQHLMCSVQPMTTISSHSYSKMWAVMMPKPIISVYHPMSCIVAVRKTFALRTKLQKHIQDLKWLIMYSILDICVVPQLRLDVSPQTNIDTPRVDSKAPLQKQWDNL